MKIEADLSRETMHRKYVRVVRRQIFIRYVTVGVAFLLGMTSFLGVLEKIAMGKSLFLVVMGIFGTYFYTRVCVRVLQGRSIWGRRPGQ